MSLHRAKNCLCFLCIFMFELFLLGHLDAYCLFSNLIWRNRVISVDITLFIQLVNFIIGLLIINHFIIKPIREVLAKRKLATDTLKEGTEEFVLRANVKLKVYEERIASAKLEVIKERERLKSEAHAKSIKLQEEASAKAAELRKEAASQRESESTKAYDVLHASTKDYARLTVERLLS